MKPLNRLVTAVSAVAFTAVLSGCGSSSSSGTAATQPSAIAGLALNAAGTSLYVANADAHIIQTLNPTLASPVVTLLAGATGQAGITEGTTTPSVGRLYSPVGITQMGGNLYVADTLNSGVRKVTSAGVISNLAGNNLGTAGNSDGTGSGATFAYPKGIANDGTHLYVADTYNHTIRRVTTAGAVQTIAGYAGSSGAIDSVNGSPRFNTPYGIAVNPACAVAGTCDLYVSDDANHAIRTVTTAGVVTTLAGKLTEFGSKNDTGILATFHSPAGIVTDGTNVYVADSGNHLIRKIVIATQVVTTLAGTVGVAGSDDGIGVAAKFNNPLGLALDAAGTTLYVSDQNLTRIRKIVLGTGAVTTLNASF